MLIRLAAILALLLSFMSGPVLAQTRATKFVGSATEFPNPERGWWTYAGGTGGFQNFTDARAAQIAKDGLRITLGLVRLDSYRDVAIPTSVLASLDKSFEHARKHGLKVILRFSYNFPLNDSDSGADAPLARVLEHIRQVGPIVTANADTIVAMQAGFIGKWGELHSSSNGLDTPENKAKIRDALYAAVPRSLSLQWRYPRDIMSWPGDTRMGFHNDCFMSSDTDVGTYSGTASVRSSQQTAMKALTGRTFFSGETCSARLSEARLGCTAILAEGASYHVSSLNRGYYTGFHDRWKAEGCFATVTRKQGYDLQLVDLQIGRRGSVSLRIKNSGWANPVQARPVVVTTFRRGVQRSKYALKGKLSEVAPGATVAFTGVDAGIGRVDRICFSAPDTSVRLAVNPAYSVRFANADGKSQVWDAKLGAFCMDIALRRR